MLLFVPVFSSPSVFSCQTETRTDANCPSTEYHGFVALSPLLKRTPHPFRIFIFFIVPAPLFVAMLRASRDQHTRPTYLGTSPTSSSSSLSTKEQRSTQLQILQQQQQRISQQYRQQQQHNVSDGMYSHMIIIYLTMRLLNYSESRTFGKTPNLGI